MTAQQIYVGSYTSQPGGGEGIGFGTLDGITVAATTADPSFLIRSADGRFLYATNEEDAGRVSAFAIQADGGLEFLNDQPTGGMHPCHLGIDPTGKYLLSANYSSGSIAIHPIGADGSLGTATQIVQREGTGPNEERQEGPHAHQVVFFGEYVFDVDLGSDTVYTSTLTGAGALEAVDLLHVHPGAGPRHLAFHPGGGAAYVINELDSTLSVCSYAKGALQVVQTLSTRPADSSGESYPASCTAPTAVTTRSRSSRSRRTLSRSSSSRPSTPAATGRATWPSARTVRCCTPPTSAPTPLPPSRSPTGCWHRPVTRPAGPSPSASCRSNQ
jgi:6-phosphogluconolactonase